MNEPSALRAGLAVRAQAEETQQSPVREPVTRDEPDCYACCDSGCAECDGSQIDQSEPWTFTGTWPEIVGGWGGSPA